MGIQVVGHTSFLGHTGYNNHSRNFFTHLDKYIPTRVRNYTYTSDLSYLKPEEYKLIIQQNLDGHPAPVGLPFIPNPNDLQVNIVLNESHHYFFYDKYEHPMIAYNVWEATRQIPEYFNRILEYDQFWCPTEWQRQCTIEQGYPEDRVKVVPEAVNGNLFKPGVSSKEKDMLYEKYNIPGDAYVCMIFGRWDYRKSITEMIQAWTNVFGKRDNCYLAISVDNPFSSDGLETTEQRLKHHKLEHDRIKVLHFPPREEYVKWMQYGACLLSCSRAEGWNLPLIEALACGTPSICSDWGGHLEFADGIAYKVNVPKELPPQQVFMLGDGHDIGVWGEPDFDHLEHVMEKVFKNYMEYKLETNSRSKYIRQLYTWDNAARKAEGYIKELVANKYHDMKPLQAPAKKKEGPLVKLNLGCGNDIKTGYINIDKYNNTGQVDLKCDLNALPFLDGSVDEIYTAHVFEHIELNDVYGVLEEWERALCLGGEIVMRLPNLEVEVNNWLNAPDDRKWFEVHRIFGSQSHPGNTHYNGHNANSLKMLVERFNFEVTSLVGDAERGYGPEIQMTAKKINRAPVNPATCAVHFVDGPFGEILGDPNDRGFYTLDFLDPDNDSHVHQQTLGINCWTRPHRKYYTNWTVTIKRNGKLIHEHKFDIKGKNVLVGLDSRSLGDTIAWMPQVEEFRKQRKCNVYLSTFWNHLFKRVYPNLKFVEPGKVVDNLYASYKVGCWEGDFNKNKIDWREVPLQKVCCDVLGIDYKEIVCKLAIHPGPRPIKEKYVAISEFSTFQCKFWNYPNAWQEIVDHLNEIGYKVMSISREETHLKNVIKMNGKPIEETITNIANAEFFMGVSAGPSWLAWALNKPVVLISGFSLPIGEFETKIERIINTDVCHGCFNVVNNNFDRGDWNWCPNHKDTERQFECTKKITPDMVKKAIYNIGKKYL